MQQIFKNYINNKAFVNYDKTNELISVIDTAAENLKYEILNTKDCIDFEGVAHYVSNNGNDDNDGLTPQTAWKTIDKINQVELGKGDAVLFERGGIFRGCVLAKSSITYSAYGVGEKPIITSSPENGAGKEKWTLLEGTKNIWIYYKEMIDVGLIVFNNGEAHSVKKIPSFVNGKFVQRNARDIDFDVRKHMHCDLAHFCDHKRPIDNAGLPDLNMKNKAPLYLRCDKGNPGEVFNSIEFSVRRCAFSVRENCNVKIDNLTVLYVGSHGVSAGTCHGLTVTNCRFSWIGGAIQYYYSKEGEYKGQVVRFGNAVEIYGGCTDYTCEHNYICQVYDAGITHQVDEGDKDLAQINISYKNNLIEYCTYSIEYFLGASTQLSGVRFMQNVLIENNIMRYSGFGFGEQRPECNAPAAHIKGWDCANPLAPYYDTYIIRNNIFDRGRNMIIHIGADKKCWLPKFENNIFIQYLNQTASSFGKFGENPTTFIPFNENVNEIISEICQSSGVYFTERDWLYDLPDFLPFSNRQ